MALELSIYVVLVWSLSYRPHRREDRLFLVFMICVFGLGLEHLSRIIFSALYLHPDTLSSTAWYYVSLYLMEALIIPIRCYMIIYIIRRLDILQSFSMHIRETVVVFVGLILIFYYGELSKHWIFIDQKRDILAIDNWTISAYGGTLMLNRILPENSIVGSWDAGVVGYMSRFPVVNLDGLVNSYDYHRSYHYHRSFNRYNFGIDWYANVRPLKKGRVSNMFWIYEGNIFGPYRGSKNGRAFYIWPFLKWLPESSDNTNDYDFNLWSKIQPEPGLQLDGIKIVVDGRFVQIFIEYCIPGRHQKNFLLLQGSENPYYYNLGNIRRNLLGLCVDSFLLPFDTGPLVEIVTTDKRAH